MSSHRIGKVCMNPPGNDTHQSRTQEFVDIELGSSRDISNHVLQHLANPGEADAHWGVMFKFPSDATFSSCTTVRVHNGAGKAGYNQARTVYHYYSGKNWLLNNDGDVVRLLNAEACEVCRRVLSGSECEDIAGKAYEPVARTATPVASYGS